MVSLGAVVARPSQLSAGAGRRAPEDAVWLEEGARMQNRGPLLTLLVVAVLAAALLAAAMVNARAAPTPAASPAAPGGPTPPGAAGPPPSVTPAPAGRSIFAGRSSGDEVTVAMAVDDGAAVAYVCDGHAIEAWLRGRVDAGQVRLTGDDGVELTGGVTARAVLGTIRGALDHELPFSADLASPPAGIYRSRTTIDGLNARFGWAVLSDGSEAGVGEIGGATGPAPWLDPTTGTFSVGGITTTATPVAGGDAVGGP